MLVLLAAAVGCVGGIYGIGGGSILAPVLTGTGRLPSEVAPAALASTFVTSVAGVVTYGTPLTDAQVLDSASAHVDTALTLTTGSDELSQSVHQAALIIKARILTDQAKYAEAAALVPSSAVPSNYQYLFATSASTKNDDL